MLSSFKRTIAAAELLLQMGLGKTIQTAVLLQVSAPLLSPRVPPISEADDPCLLPPNCRICCHDLLQLAHERGLTTGPVAVVVPLSTFGGWERELAKWAPGLEVLSYAGSQEARALIRK